MFSNKNFILLVAAAGFMLAVAVFAVFPINSRAAILNEYEAELWKKLENIQHQIEESKTDLKQTQGQSQTLSRQIKIYDTEIKKTLLELEETNLMLQESELALLHISNEMKVIDNAIEKQKIFLQSSIRAIYEYNQSEMELILGAKKLSDFFDQMNSVEMINKKVGEALSNIKISKEEYLKIEEQLKGEKETQEEIKLSQEFKKKSLDSKKTEKNQLLKETKGRESLYKQKIAESEKRANEIRNQLFVLQNMGGTLKFEEAVKLASYAGQATGIRPAFLLAILSKETNIGKNLGKGSWTEDMNPNQREAYLSITKKLGLDPDKMPVSATPSYGWGGAMGPAQFLPKTWLAFEDRVASITGHNPPNPWNLSDAFVASALYLSDLGADAKTENAEWTAAMKYLAGSNWQKKSLRFYGDHVIEIAKKIQADIDIMMKEN